MPTYRNDTETRITFPDKHYISWQPGEQKALPFFVPHEMLGLTLVSPEPHVLRDPARGFGYTEFIVKAGAPTVYKLPYAETIELSVMAPKGLVRMYVGDRAEPIAVDPQNNHASRYPWDMSAYLTFETDKDTEVYVKVEPFTEKGE